MREFIIKIERFKCNRGAVRKNFKREREGEREGSHEGPARVLPFHRFSYNGILMEREREVQPFPKFFYNEQSEREREKERERERELVCC